MQLRQWHWRKVLCVRTFRLEIMIIKKYLRYDKQKNNESIQMARCDANARGGNGGALHGVGTKYYYPYKARKWRRNRGKSLSD